MGLIRSDSAVSGLVTRVVELSHCKIAVVEFCAVRVQVYLDWGAFSLLLDLCEARREIFRGGMELDRLSDPLTYLLPRFNESAVLQFQRFLFFPYIFSQVDQAQLVHYLYLAACASIIFYRGKRIRQTYL